MFANLRLNCIYAYMKIKLTAAPELVINGTLHKGIPFYILNILILLITIVSKFIQVVTRSAGKKSVHAFIAVEMFSVFWNVWLILLISTQNFIIIGNVLLSVTTAKLLMRNYEERKRKQKESNFNQAVH